MAKLAVKVNRNLIILVVLLLIGFFLRVVDINNVPKAIYGDGLTLVYDSYSLLKTGHDQKENPFPFIFQQGDHRPPGYVYFSIPFVAIFGPTVLGANGLSIASGMGLMILLYLLGKKFYSERVGLLAAGMSAISPWDLSLSRGTYETHFALFCAVLGVYSYFKAKQQIRWIIIASISFGLASITYPTYGLTSPLLYLWLLVWIKDRKTFIRQNLILMIAAAVISAIFAVASLQIIHSGNNPTRAESINIFSRPDVKRQINQQVMSDRKLDSSPQFLTSLLHNQFWSYSTLLAENYIENFRPNFLLISGDGEPRHNPAETGEIYWASGALIILGIVFLYTKRLLALLLGWLMIAPLATAFISPPHALRDSLMLPPLILLSAFGAEKLWSSRRRIRNLVVLGIIGLYLIEIIFFMDRFFFIAPNKFSRFWAYPAKQASQIAIEQKNNYNTIILSTRIDNMEFAYPVYARLEPEDVQYQNQHHTTIDQFQFLKYGNVYIGSVPDTRVKDFIQKLPGSVLYIGPDTDQQFADVKSILSGPDLNPDLAISEKR